jgi:hypothetical protein
MHAFIHRALAPQTISHAWLVLTLALTFAQSAIATGQSLAAAGLPTARIALAMPEPAPVRAPDAARCRAATPAEAPRAGVHRTAARHAACRAGAAWANPAFSVPAPHATGADALAAIYGGAGPHGPPNRTRVPERTGLLTHGLTLDFSLSFTRSAASRPAVEASSSLTPIAGAPA